MAARATDGRINAPAGRRIRDAFDRIRDGARKLTTASPARFALLVFLVLILLFTTLLSLPAAAASGRSTPFADALFTAVSTICVTGLSTVDMGTHWSPLGQVIIYVGVNVGALGVLTLASILGLIISKRLGLRAKLIAAGDTNPLRVHGGPVNEGQTVMLGEIGSLLATVALSTLIIEAALAIMLYPSLLVGGVDPLAA
ncbi:MAG: TrkH family potassium uptake protein, partial [Microbacterium sp.]|nr:TrkH family potassium uptake protein [Microbacterium sp.]